MITRYDREIRSGTGMIMCLVIRGGFIHGRIVGQPVKRAASGFFQDFPDVFPQNTQPHKVDTSKKGNQDGHGGPAWNGGSGNIAVNDMKDQEPTSQCGKDAYIESQMKGNSGIGDYAIHSEMQHFLHGKFRDSRMTFRCFKFDGCLFKAHAAYNSPDKTAVFSETAEYLDGFFIHKPENQNHRERWGFLK